MAKTRAIVKSCPKCDHNVAVASKACKCGYTFFQARRSTRAVSLDQRTSARRTSRVRREKPNYYDSQEYDKKKKKKDRRGRPPANRILPQEKKEAPPKVVNSKETTALRAKRRRMRKELEDGGGDLCAKLSLEKQELAAIILSEINRKNCSVFWSPSF